jgi:hypothetical protein
MQSASQADRTHRQIGLTGGRYMHVDKTRHIGRHYRQAGRHTEERHFRTDLKVGTLAGRTGRQADIPKRDT